MDTNLTIRLKYLRKELRMTQVDMANLLGIKQNSYSSIENGKSSMTDRNKNRLCEALNVNKEWLDGVEGVEMMSKKDLDTARLFYSSSLDEDTRELVDSDPAISDFDIFGNKEKAETCKTTFKEVQDTQKGRPYFDIDFICGFDELFNSHTTTPAYLIDYPPYNKDGVIWCNATGSSMEPEIGNGDVVVLQEVQDWDSYMTFGETYAIATRNNLRTIKKVRKGSDNDHLLLVPVNKEYDEQEIPKNMILKVFRVLAAMKKF